MKTPLLLALVLCAPAFASDAKKPPPKQKLNLDMPTFGAIPKGDEIQKPKSGEKVMTPTTTSVDAKYEVTKVQHGKSFMRSGSGASPVGGGMGEIALSGNPPATEKFTSAIRVKCDQKMNAPINVVILDPRGDTFMSAEGELNFRAANKNEVDWQVEWDPTPARAPGDFKVLVRVAGQVMGTWPLKVVASADKK